MFSATKGGSPSGYQISRSVRLRISAGGYLNRTLSASGSTSQWTYSAWTKRGTLGSFNVLLSSCITGSTYFQSVLAFDSSDKLWYYQFSNGSGYAVNVTSTAVFRDPSAWYHVVMKFDASTSSMIVWVNNQQVINSSSFSTTNRLINSNNVHYIGNYAYQTVDPGRYDGYLTEVNFIDGQALTPSSFGQTNGVTGVWSPIKYTGTYGTNGFYLNFSDNSAATAAAIGKDYSGNGNNWTPNNISVTAGVTYDSMLDVPTLWADGGNGRGNYCVINSIASAVADTYSQANLKWTKVANTTNTSAVGSIPISSGKWYWEGTVAAAGGSNLTIGIGNINTNFVSLDSNLGMTGSTTSYSYNGGSGPYKQNNNTQTSYGATFTTNDVIGVAFDADAGTLTFYKNNTSQGTAFTGITGTFTPACGGRFTNDSWYMNFGQRPFAYTPPTGFKALNTLNLPEPTISNGANYMAATTYTGTGSALSVSNAVNGVSFQPDFVWTKPRSTAVGHTLFDSLRGVTKYLQSNTTGAEGTAATSLTAFNSDGFTVNSDTSTGANGVTYIGWQWKKGATQGFDIVTYTGTGVAQNIAHSLGVKPAMMIIKNRSGAYDWPTWHQNLPNPTTQNFWLNATNAAQTSGSFNSTQPTSSVFSVGTTGEANANGNNFVAYLFATVSGYSAFGSYTGNGSTDGTFVFTGFRPRWVLIKCSSAGSTNWILHDTAREPYNLATASLYPNLSNAETVAASQSLDILSNGFKLRNTSGDINSSGATYIYAAFCESPFKNSLAR
jgi:hypothetical protein